MDKRLLIEKVAIKKDGNAIMYTKDPSEELCMIAVKENGRSLQCIKCKT